MSKEIERIKKYIERRKQVSSIDIENVHAFDTGCESEAELLLSDIEKLLFDAEMFAWIHSKKRTESKALVDLEIRMLNDDYPTIEEVRAAVADAMAKEKI